MKCSDLVVLLVIHLASLNLVNGEKPETPVLSTNNTDPADADTVLLTCTSTTQDISVYEFYKDGSLIQDDLTNTLSLGPGIPFFVHNANYKCKAKKAHKTSDFSNELTVTKKPNKPTIAITSPVDQPIDGDSVVLEFLTSTQGMVGVFFLFDLYKDGALLFDNLGGGRVIAPATLGVHDGEYFVVAKFIGGVDAVESERSDPVTLTLRPKTPIADFQSYSGEVEHDAYPFFLCNGASGGGVRTFNWYKGGALVQSELNPTLKLNILEENEEGCYACTYSIKGVESHPSCVGCIYLPDTNKDECELFGCKNGATCVEGDECRPYNCQCTPEWKGEFCDEPSGIIISNKPTIGIVNDGNPTDMDSVHIMCGIDDFAASQYDFYKDGVKETSFVENHEIISGYTAGVLTILHAVVGEHDGSYTCVARTDEGVASDSSDPFILTLRPQAPILTSNSTETEVGKTVQLVATSKTGGNPLFTFSRGAVVQSGESGSFVIPSFQDTDAGPYSATVTINGQESDASNFIMLSTAEDTAVVPESVSCLPGWSFFDYNKQCFKYFYEEKIWIKAHDSCVSEGGVLASPRRPREKTFLEDVVTKSGGNRAIWLNIKDYKDGQWVWQDTQTEVDWFHWVGDVTPEKGPRRDCVVMFEEVGDREYYWRDIQCDEKAYNYVCVKDAEPTSPAEGVVQIIRSLESRIEELDEKLQAQSHVESGLMYCGRSFGFGVKPGGDSAIGPCIEECDIEDPASCPLFKRCVFNGCGHVCRVAFTEITVKFSRIYPQPPSVVASVAWGQWDANVAGSVYVWAHDVTETGFTLRCGAYDPDSLIMNLAATWVASPHP